MAIKLDGILVSGDSNVGINGGAAIVLKTCATVRFCCGWRR